DAAAARVVDLYADGVAALFGIGVAGKHAEGAIAVVLDQAGIRGAPIPPIDGRAVVGDHSTGVGIVEGREHHRAGGRSFHGADRLADRAQGGIVYLGRAGGGRHAAALVGDRDADGVGSFLRVIVASQDVETTAVIRRHKPVRDVAVAPVDRGREVA